MILLKNGNVERIASTESQAVRLEKQGFRRIDGNPKVTEAKTQKPLGEMTVAELKVLAKEKGLEGYSGLSKDDLISVLKDVV